MQDTDSKDAAETELQKMRFCLDHMIDAVFWVGPEGRILYANKTACQERGYSQEELLGLSIFDLDTEPNYQPGQWEKHFADLKSRGAITLETRHRSKDGRIIPIEVTARYVQVGDSEFNFSQVRNITDRKLSEQNLASAEARLNESHNQLSSIYDAVGDVIFLLDVEPDGGFRFRSVNNAFVACTGLPRAAVLDKRIEEIIPEPSRTLVLHNYRRAIKEKQLVRWEETSTYPTGTLVGEVSIVPIFTEDGRCPQLVGSVHDITKRKAAELALHESERRLSEAQKIARTGSWGWDPFTGNVWWSDSLYEIYGIAKATIQPSFEAFLSLVHPEDRSTAQARAEAMLSGQTEFVNELRIIRPDGTLAWLSSRARSNRDSSGNIIRIEGTDQDITDQKIAEIALMESETRLQIALQAASAIAFVWDAKSDQVTRYFSTEPALPANVRNPETVAQVRARVHPSDVEKFDAGVKSVLAKGSDYRNLFRVIRPDGTIRWLEEWGHLERNHDSSPRKLTGVSIDITERMQAEAELRKTGDLLRAIADETTDAIYVKDRDGKYLLFNQAAARLVGKTVEEVIGADDTTIFDLAGAASLMETDRRIMQSQMVETQTDTLTAANTTRTYHSTKAPYRDLNGKVVGVIGVSRDITEQVRAEKERQDSEDRYRLAILATKDAVWDFDPFTGLVQWNEQYLTTFGRPPEASSWEWWIGHIHADDRERTIQSFRQAINGMDQYWACEYRFLRVDGVWAEVQDRAYIARDAKGTARRIVGTVLDLTSHRDAEKVLRLSQFTIDHAVDSLFWINPAGNILYVNDAACKLLEYTRHELQGKHLSEIEIGLTKEAWLARWKDIKQTGSFTFPSDRITNSGRILNTEVTVNYLKHEGQEYTCAVMRDITDRKRTEEDLRRLWENAIDPLCIAGSDGYLKKLNPAWSNCLGWSEEELLNRPFLDFVHPDDIDDTLTAFTKMRAGVPIPSFENRYRCKDGSYRQFLWNAVPRREGGGYGFVRDVTERKQAEDLLERERDFLRKIIDSHFGFICVLTLDSRISEINQLSLTLMKVSREETIGRLFTDMDWIVDRDVLRVLNAINTAAQGHTNRLEVTASFPELGLRNIDAVFSPLKNASGDVINVVGFGVDITEQKQLALQLQHSHKLDAVGRLAGGIAHDFNNLLTIIIGYGSLALNESHSNPTLRESIQAVLDAGDRAASLTKQLLAFSRKSIIEPVLLDLNELIERDSLMFRRLIEEDITLCIACDRTLPRILAAPGQIEQVLMNIIVNARDAMPHGGSISIKTRSVKQGQANATAYPNIQPGDYAQITISDTGHGMPQDIINMVFEPFFTTKDIGQGTGLGLSVVHGIVMQAGGTISLNSELNVGTTFTIMFPAATHIPRTTQEESLLQADHHGETILLVEDESAVRTIARISLKKYGYQVLEARNAAEVFGFAEDQSQHIDLLLTDVVMPDASGPEIAAAVKNIRPEIRVLLMSGYTNNTVLQRGVEQSNTTLLQKPFTALSLVQKVRAVLDAKK